MIKRSSDVISYEGRHGWRRVKSVAARNEVRFYQARVRAFWLIVIACLVTVGVVGAAACLWPSPWANAIVGVVAAIAGGIGVHARANLKRERKAHLARLADLARK